MNIGQLRMNERGEERREEEVGRRIGREKEKKTSILSEDNSS